jgi:hypothetical protein
MMHIGYRDFVELQRRAAKAGCLSGGKGDNSDDSETGHRLCQG